MFVCSGRLFLAVAAHIHVSLTQTFELDVEVSRIRARALAHHAEPAPVDASLPGRICGHGLLDVRQSLCCRFNRRVVPKGLHQPALRGAIVGVVQFIVLKHLGRRREAVRLPVDAALELASLTRADVDRLRAGRARRLVLELQLVGRQPVPEGHGGPLLQGGQGRQQQRRHRVQGRAPRHRQHLHAERALGHSFNSFRPPGLLCSCVCIGARLGNTYRSAITGPEWDTRHPRVASHTDTQIDDR